jgi:diamine N-acetyltransferase
MQIFIKKANENDTDTLQNIAKTTFVETYAAQNTAEQMAEYVATHFNIESLKAELTNPASAFYFAYANDELVGYLKVNFAAAQTDIHDTESLEIERIYVLKNYYGKQIGHFLYEKAAEIAKKAHLNYIWLGVWEYNPRALRFYEKMGFEHFGTHVFDFNGDAQTDILMRKGVDF